jgi:hypothetical protein
MISHEWEEMVQSEHESAPLRYASVLFSGRPKCHLCLRALAVNVSSNFRVGCPILRRRCPDHHAPTMQDGALCLHYVAYPPLIRA